jgi:hypothetical protein
VGVFALIVFSFADTIYREVAMKGVGVLCVLTGIAIFVLPLLRVHLSLIYALGDFRAIAAITLILIGIGIFLFSND